jgi:hypothetical protein
MIGAWFALNAPQAQKIVLDAPDGTLSDEAQMEARFGPFGDSVSFSAR